MSERRRRGDWRLAATPAIEARFWPKVGAANGDGCREWTAGRLPSGYGLFYVRSGESKRVAHRVAWILVNGEIDTPDTFVLHECDNPPCCETDHLFLGSASVNQQDMFRKSRHPSRRLDDRDLALIRFLGSEGVPKTAIARHLSVHVQHVHQILSRRRSGYLDGRAPDDVTAWHQLAIDLVAEERSRRLGRRARGEAQGSSRLTEDAVREIRVSTETISALARRFGVARRTVQHAREGRTWSHIR